jgi:hypothetical protein
MSSVKMIQNCFEKGQSMNFNDIDKFNDISAITSTLKNYFRQLPNPLFTFELHEAFVTVASKPFLMLMMKIPHGSVTYNEETEFYCCCCCSDGAREHPIGSA